MSSHDVFGFSLSFLIPMIIAGVVAKLVVSMDKAGRLAGAQVGNVIVQAVSHDVSPLLRPMVIAELQTIAGDVTARSQTVVATSEAILARVLPAVPMATRAQVANIAGEFVRTFEAGLVDTLQTANTSPTMVTETAVVVSTVEKPLP